MRVKAFFDARVVPRPGYARLWREAWSLLTYRPPEPPAEALGGGEIVLVIPAFLTTDAITAALRGYLERCGFRAFGWALGVNWGPTPRLLAGLRARLTELAQLTNGKVSVVGVSLGGLLARDLVHDRAAEIRKVVTLAAPCRLPTASTIVPLFRLTAPFYAATIDVARLSQPLPVPTMMIYTSDDGIVAWQSCRDEPGGTVAIAADLRGAHRTICSNPVTLSAVSSWLSLR